MDFPDRTKTTPSRPPHNLLPGWLFLLSFTITNHPFNASAWLTVPVVISPVVASKTSFRERACTQSRGTIALPNRARNKSAGMLGSRRGSQLEFYAGLKGWDVRGAISGGAVAALRLEPPAMEFSLGQP
jgi:hypothetical protein